MNIIFQYHGVNRTKEHEDTVSSHLQSALNHAQNITKVVVRTEMDGSHHMKIHVDVHMPQNKNFSGYKVVGYQESMDHALSSLSKTLSNWIEHHKVRHVHDKKHSCCDKDHD